MLNTSAETGRRLQVAGEQEGLRRANEAAIIGLAVAVYVGHQVRQDIKPPIEPRVGINRGVAETVTRSDRAGQVNVRCIADEAAIFGTRGFTRKLLHRQIDADAGFGLRAAQPRIGDWDASVL